MRTIIFWSKFFCTDNTPIGVTQRQRQNSLQTKFLTTETKVFSTDDTPIGALGLCVETTGFSLVKTKPEAIFHICVCVCVCMCMFMCEKKKRTAHASRQYAIGFSLVSLGKTKPEAINFEFQRLPGRLLPGWQSPPPRPPQAPTVRQRRRSVLLASGRRRRGAVLGARRRGLDGREHRARVRCLCGGGVSQYASAGGGGEAEERGLSCCALVDTWRGAVCVMRAVEGGLRDGVRGRAGGRW